MTETQASSKLPSTLPFPPVTPQHILNTSFHSWYPKFRSLTPKSRIIPLSRPFLDYLRADGIILPPEHRQQNTDPEDSGYDDEGDDESPDPSEQWADLHATITTTIRELGGKVLPKLNWSAPKDATWISATNDMECRTANDVYLLLKSSDFVTHDLEHAFDGCEVKEGEPLPEVRYHLVLRKAFNLNPSLEFRCFVRNRRLIAISQREMNYFDFLFELRPKFKALIQDFLEEKLLGGEKGFSDENFVFDVYIPPPHDRVWLIDINPWAPRTDPLLFSWLELLTMEVPDVPETCTQENAEEADDGREEFVRLTLAPQNTCQAYSASQSTQSPDESDEDDDLENVFDPEFRLVQRDDPEAYQFSATKYSAHKLPKDVVDASLAPGGMKDMMEEWKKVMNGQEQESDSEEETRAGTVDARPFEGREVSKLRPEMEPPTNADGVVDPEAGTTAAQDGGLPAAETTQTSSSAMTDFSCVYFGYGSNLSPRTMKQRCPDSLFIGLAELKDWKWIINETGYANIIPSPGDVVYGSLCFLSKRDEMALDESEGIPWLYEKQTLPVKRLLTDAEKSSDWGTGGDVQVHAAAYVDVQRATVGKIEKEYVVWVKKAIDDGITAGMPKEYAEKYLVPFLPTDDQKLADIVMIFHANSIIALHAIILQTYTNMPGDATILEGPVTPAPLFAYRAIRSIFFASPDSSPEHYGKENMVPTYSKSPTKSKWKAPNSPQLTPSQKRKREVVVNGGVVLSPTKGILRTPGLATPRAKALRDVNVKFKSVSPEVRRTNATVQNTSPSMPRAQLALEAIRPEQPKTAPATANQAKKSEARVTKTDTGVLPSATLQCPLVPAAIEAYMAQTEKEMKRLIRYGKKMREYALRKDAENQELKIMIDELRRENERLRTSGTITTRTLGQDLKMVEEHPQKIKDKTPHTTSKAISPALRNKNRGYVREEVDRVETTVKVQAFTDLKPQPRSFSDTMKPKTVPSRVFPDVRRRGDSTTATALISMSGDPSAKHTDNIVTSIPTSTTATNNGTLRLPPDRAAAARERLRKRAEARKTSAEIAFATKDQTEDIAFKHCVSQELAKVREAVDGLDEPSFDWANL
ncbi:hypothetical protein H2200_012128 [Cladophialophora chaetospira]|uniref:Cell division cycle protein 123 n=1 Tax=Cladophialophora chaetospira TaxID=386627 RepID=A0AA39CCN1_9EURO|nr:hypothetical protein H2200_012128 [Cladophialophora chaetospira]